MLNQNPEQIVRDKIDKSFKEAGCSVQNKKEVESIISLIRKISGIKRGLTLYSQVLDRNFQKWILKKHEETKKKFLRKSISAG